jgi:hypothetical protein
VKRDARIAVLARFAAIGLSLLSLAGCSPDAFLQKFTSAEDQATAKKYVDYLRHGQYAQIEAVADPGIQGPALHPMLEQMARLIPDEEPSSIKLIAAQTMQGPDGAAKNLTFEYRFGERWLLVNVATQQTQNAFTIVGFNVYPQAQSLQEQNRFTLNGKAAGQYLLLALAVLFPLLTLYALILCVRTKMARRKWLWIIFILLGVGQLAVNWTTGEWNFMPLMVQLFSVSALSSGYGPWVVGVSLPLGAIMFLFRRRALQVEQDYE